MYDVEIGDIYKDWQRKFDMVTGFVYPYRCLNDNKTGWGTFNHPNTRKVA